MKIGVNMQVLDQLVKEGKIDHTELYRLGLEVVTGYRAAISEDTTKKYDHYDKDNNWCRFERYQDAYYEDVALCYKRRHFDVGCKNGRTAVLFNNGKWNTMFRNPEDAIALNNERLHRMFVKERKALDQWLKAVAVFNH